MNNYSKDQKIQISQIPDGGRTPS